jgi:V/A-type H+-transporting ATPase subunit I
VWFGFFVKLYIDFKKRDLKAAFYDELPWLVAMTLIGVIVVLFFAKAPISTMYVPAGITLLCWLVILLFAGRESSNPVARLGTGGFELYTKITGTFGDVLSYLRLFALGLATGIIAGVINTMAMMMWGSLVGKVAAIGILLGGHIFNLVINALGGFIHTARLQFVEFFTKFYEGGGEEFKPFMREHTYIKIVDLEDPQEE